MGHPLLVQLQAVRDQTSGTLLECVRVVLLEKHGGSFWRQTVEFQKTGHQEQRQRRQGDGVLRVNGDATGGHARANREHYHQR